VQVTIIFPRRKDRASNWHEWSFDERQLDNGEGQAALGVFAEAIASTFDWVLIG